MSPDAVLLALEEIERALLELREAYASWLASDGDDHGHTKLRAALTETETRLASARAALARAAGDETYSS